MKIQVLSKTFSTAILLMIVGVLVNCSIFSAADSGYTLEYGKETGKVTTYTITGSGSSTMEVQGQVMGQSESLSGTVTHVVTSGSSNILNHELTFSNLSINADGDMAGSLSLDTSPIIGAKLKITTGKQGDKLKFVNFKDIPRMEGLLPPHLNLIEILPILANYSVNVSDTWKGSREYNIETPDGGIATSSEIDYLFAGMEERLGFDCVKITATDNFSMSGSGIALGMNIEFSGYGVNTNTYYFAHKEGILIEVDSQSLVSMSIILTDMGMTIPMESKGSLKLVYNK